MVFQVAKFIISAPAKALPAPPTLKQYHFAQIITDLGVMGSPFTPDERSGKNSTERKKSFYQS